MRAAALTAFLAVALIVALAAGGCGESKEEKATDQVCSARADIGKQVDTLKALTVSTATIDQIRTSLQAIRADLSKITDARGDLSGQRKQQVQAANQAFSSEVKSIVSELGSSLSLSSAKQQLTAALQQLGSSYQQTLARIDCGS
jgi:uncharacterized protein YhaN